MTLVHALWALEREIEGLSDQLYRENERAILALMREIEFLAWVLRRQRMTDSEFAAWLNGLVRKYGY